LDLALLVNREHDRVRWRVDVTPDHIAHLGGEPRVAAELNADLPAEGRLRRMQPPLSRERDTAFLGDGNEVV
jgi:hypothetical protein